MFFGDSITNGDGADSSLRYGGYRGFFQKLMLGIGFKSFVAVGPFISNGPFEAGLYANNLGGPGDGFVGGFGGEILPNLWKTYGKSYEPDLILLQGGSNDVVLGVPIANSITEAQKMIEQIFVDRPNARLVMGNVHKIFSPYITDTQVKAYNVAWFNLYTSLKAEGKNVYFADLYTAIQNQLTANGGSIAGILSPDGVHPLMSGYSTIANTFFNTGVIVLNKDKKTDDKDKKDKDDKEKKDK